MTPALAVFVGILGAAVLSMAVYALTGRRRDADAEKKGSQFLLGIGDFLVHWLMWVLRPVEHLALRAGLTPDFFNFAGLAFGMLSGHLIGTGRLELGGWAIAAGGLCDILDGRIARARGLVSAYGQFIDSTLDRFVEVFVFLGFVFYLRPFAWGPSIAAAAITGSLLVSYTRARGESVGVLCKEGLMQRAERLVLTFLACLLDRPVTAALGWPRGMVLIWVLGLIAIGTFATAVQRTWWISARLREKGRAP